MDLLLLAKVVRMEADIRRQQNTLDRSGVLVENKRGTVVPNPLLAVIDTLERRQMAVIRSMSLNQTDSDPRTINGAAKNSSGTSDALRDMWASGLIAKPVVN
jgi:hypothetical protein